MWLADMDFATPTPIVEAIAKAVAPGQALGYVDISDRLRQVCIEWLQRHYNWQTKSEYQLWIPGMVPSLYAACRAFAQPQGKIAVPCPVYGPFREAVQRSGRTLVELPLTKVDGRMILTAETLAQASDAGNAIEMLLFCNPQNPSGTVYTRTELQSIVDECRRQGITICSDEIHADINMSERCCHIPLPSIDGAADIAVSLHAASKTFNIAGLSCSVIVAPSATLRAALIEQTRGLLPEPNGLGLIATEYAWNGHCDQWHQQMLAYLRANLALIKTRVANIDRLRLVEPEAGFLAYIDCTELVDAKPELIQGGKTLRLWFEQFGVGLSDGSEFNQPGYIRLNYATSRELLARGLQALEQASEAIEAI